MAQKTQKLMFTSLLKDMIKDTDGQSDEEVHRGRSGRVPSTGASVPWSWGMSPSWYRCVHQPGRKLHEPHTTEIFMETLSHMHA